MTAAQAGTATDRWLIPLGLLSLFVLQAIFLALWLGHDGTPTGLVNEFAHLNTTVDAWGELRAGSLSGLGPALFGVDPPLQALVGVLALLVTGGDEDTLRATSLLWSALLLLSTYGLGARLAGPRTGLAAAALVTLYPAVLGSAGHFEPASPVAATSTWAIWMIAIAGDRPRAWAWAGVASAAAILAERMTAVPALVGATLAMLVLPMLQGLWRRTDRTQTRTDLRCLGAFVGVQALLAGPWLVSFLRMHLGYMLEQLSGEVTYGGVATEARSYADPFTWLYYPLDVIDLQLGLVAGAAALICTVIFLVRARGDVATSMRGALLLSLLVLTLVLKKQPFYSHNLLPLLAVCTAWGLSRLPRGVNLGALAVIVAGLAFLDARVTLDRPLSEDSAARWLGYQPLPESVGERLGPRYELLSRPDHLDWSLDEATEVMWDQGWSPDECVLFVGENHELPEDIMGAMIRMRLKARWAAGWSVGTFVIGERGADCTWLIYLGGPTSPAWPTRESMTAFAEEITWGPPDAGFWAVFDALEPRAEEVAAFAQPGDATLRVFRFR